MEHPMSNRLSVFRSTEPAADPLVTLAAELQAMLDGAKPPAVKVAENRLTVARGKRAAIVAEQRELANVAAENQRQIPKADAERLNAALADAERDVAAAQGAARDARAAFAREIVGKVAPYRERAARRLVDALETAALAMAVLGTADRFVALQGLVTFGQSPFPAPTPQFDLIGALNAARKIAGVPATEFAART